MSGYASWVFIKIAVRQMMKNYHHNTYLCSISFTNIIIY
jgi:hypothetical protein